LFQKDTIFFIFAYFFGAKIILFFKSKIFVLKKDEIDCVEGYAIQMVAQYSKISIFLKIKSIKQYGQNSPKFFR